MFSNTNMITVFKKWRKTLKQEIIIYMGNAHNILSFLKRYKTVCLIWF